MNPAHILPSQAMLDSSDASSSVHRDAALETLRGIAALIVVAWHLMLAFAPARGGIFPDLDHALSINGRWWFWALNGPASVTFFFVLSGFVLTRRALSENDPASIVRGAVKRWPRLALLTTIVCIVSWALGQSGAYLYVQAAAQTHSPWLASFAYSPAPPGPETSIGSALWEGATTFFTGALSFDSSLWTMKIEFFGSLIAFGAALALMAIKSPARQIALMFALTIICRNLDRNYPCFIVGVCLARWLPSQTVRVPLAVAGPLLLLAMWLGGYSANERGDFAWIGVHPNAVYVQTVSAALVIALVGSVPSLHRLLSKPWGRVLGKLSFPLYLLHVPILCSAGCAVFLSVSETHPTAALPATAVATIALTLAISAPLAWLDTSWTRLLNKAAKLPSLELSLFRKSNEADQSMRQEG